MALVAFRIALVPTEDIHVVTVVVIGPTEEILGVNLQKTMNER